MSLHPIKALDHVIDEYSDYLRTEFRAALRKQIGRLGGGENVPARLGIFPGFAKGTEESRPFFEEIKR